MIISKTSFVQLALLTCTSRIMINSISTTNHVNGILVTSQVLFSNENNSITNHIIPKEPRIILDSNRFISLLITFINPLESQYKQSAILTQINGSVTAKSAYINAGINSLKGYNCCSSRCVPYQ